MTAHRRVIEDEAGLRARVSARRADRLARLHQQFDGPIPPRLIAWANEGAETLDGHGHSQRNSSAG